MVLQLGRSSRAVIFYCVSVVFALNTVTRTLAVKNATAELVPPTENGTKATDVQQTSSVNISEVATTELVLKKHKETCYCIQCYCCFWHCRWCYFQKDCDWYTDHHRRHKRGRNKNCRYKYLECEDMNEPSEWCHCEIADYFCRRCRKMRPMCHYGDICICCKQETELTTTPPTQPPSKEITKRPTTVTEKTKSSPTNKTTTKGTTKRPNREKLPGIISGGLGILSVLLISVYLCITRFPFEECLHPEEKEDEELSESSSDEEYDFGDFNEEELAKKAAFEWTLERDIRSQEIADTLILAVIPSKRLKFKYESNENKDSQEGRVISSIEVEDSPKRKRKSKSHKNKDNEPQFLKIDDISKHKATTTVKVFVNKPILDQAAKSEECGPISKEPDGILAADTGKVRTTASPMYDVPKCSKPMYDVPKCSKPMYDVPKSKKKDTKLQQTPTAATVRNTYETLNDTEIKKRDHQTRKLPELPSIKIDMADETKKREDQPDQFRLITRQGDSGIYEEIDDVISNTSTL